MSPRKVETKMLNKKMLSWVGTMGVLFSMPAMARVVTEVDSLNDFRCDVRVKTGSGTMEIENIAAEFGVYGDKHHGSRFDFSRSGAIRKIRIKDPEWNKTVGITTDCLSLYGSFGLAKVQTAKKYLVPLPGGKFLDVCWVMDTGVNEAGGKHQPGALRLILAERSVSGDYLSLSRGDQYLQELNVEGARTETARIGAYEVEATCRSTEMPDGTMEESLRKLQETLEHGTSAAVSDRAVKPVIESPSHSSDPLDTEQLFSGSAR